MKSLLLLVALLAPSSASLLDTVNFTELTDVPFLDPELGERILEISDNDSMPSDEPLLNPPVELAIRRSQVPPTNFEGTNLEWVTWRGFLPNGAVSIYNRRSRRYDYVCKFKCEAGLYSPNLGHYCYYPYGKKEYISASFQILVNKDNFEFLEWKSSSFGSVTANSVGTCSGSGVYVGRNKYGLGKVVPEQRAFFLPWRGKSYWYRRRYEVLTMNRGVASEYISDIKYKIESSNIFYFPPVTIRISSITNNACSDVVKVATLSKTSLVEHSWEISFSISAGAKNTIKTAIPSVTDRKIEFGPEITLEFSNGHSKSEEISHSVSVEVDVPSNHHCRVRLVGHKYKADVPFTAQLTRTYHSGRIVKTVVTGMFHGIQIGEVSAVVDRCQSVPFAKPCH
uniref:Natterin-3-like n=2 Tax=Seriola lalandi dorsalis TaxID=1841481 RepID=A0A3B4YQT2_SERLL